MKKHKSGIGLKNALRGVAVVTRGEHNFIIQIVCAAAVVTLSFLCRIEPWGWAAVLICCGLVLFAELLNTALEKLCDRVTDEKCQQIRDVKDISAGAVLVCCIISVIVFCVVFMRPVIWENFLSVFS